MEAQPRRAAARSTPRMALGAKRELWVWDIIPSSVGAPQDPLTPSTTHGWGHVHCIL